VVQRFKIFLPRTKQPGGHFCARDIDLRPARAGTAFIVSQRYNFLMDELRDISFRLRVSNLQAKQELLEIERADLSREATTAWTLPGPRERALARRLVLAEHCAEITEQLKLLEESASKR
jgi:hypothetical protein